MLPLVPTSHWCLPVVLVPVLNICRWKAEGKHTSCIFTHRVRPPLLQGYPRADIDVAAIRNDRHKLACLNTDHGVLSKDVERLLMQLHAATKCGAGGADSAR